MLREWQVANQAGLSPQEVHCHQYLATGIHYLMLATSRGDSKNRRE